MVQSNGPARCHRARAVDKLLSALAGPAGDPSLSLRKSKAARTVNASLGLGSLNGCPYWRSYLIYNMW